MKKLLLYVSLLTIHGFMEAAAQGQPSIIWEVGVSGAVHHPCFHPFYFAKTRSVGNLYPTLFGDITAPLVVEFDHSAQSDDADKLLKLRPSPEESVTQIAIKLPSGYANWDRLPDNAAIVLRYSYATKVAASLMLSLEADPIPSVRWY